MRKGNKITDGVKIGFYVPVEWHDTIKNLAEENAMSIADLCRQAVKEYVEKHRGTVLK